jgi:outer membrane receptor protein involved in Fe transport
MRRAGLVACALAAFSAAGVLFAAPPSARADDVTDLEGLLDQSVVTTASKSAEVGTTAPAISTTITAEDMRRYGIHSLDEAIDFLSLGAVTSDPLKAVDVGARGVLVPNDNGDHFLLLVNGHQMNEPLFGSARFGRGLGIPFEMIDHIEVVLGPGSVLYGSNAMLGVINVITKQAKDWHGFHVAAETEIAKSYRALAGAGTTFTLLGKEAWITLGAEYYTQDGPPLVYGFEYEGIDPASIQPYKFRRDQPGNGFWGGLAKNGWYTRAPSGLLRLVWGDFELSVNAKAYKRAHPYRARYTDDFSDFDDPDSYELDRHLWADLTFHRRLSPVIDLTTRLYGDTWDYQAFRNSSEASACLTAGDAAIPTCTFSSPGISRWAGLETRTRFDWLKNDRFVTMLGVDGRVRREGLKIDALDFQTRRPLTSSLGSLSRQDQLFGAYIQQTWVPLSWLSLNGGARVDDENRFRGVVSPRFAASASTWKGGTLKGIYAEAFRSPSVVETDLENPIQILAQDLRPERVRSVEASVEQRVGAQRLLLGVFRSWWTDLVEQHVLTRAEQEDAVRRGEISALSYGVAQFRNVSSIDNYGINGAFEGSAGGDQQLRYGVNLTGAVAHKEEAGGATIEAIPVAPAVFGNARVSYDLPGELPTLAVATHYLSRRPIDRAYDGTWPVRPYADAQLELRATISGPVPKLKRLTYRGSVNWLLADHGPYAVGPAQAAERYNQAPQLVPLDTFRATVGLEWSFDP